MPNITASGTYDKDTAGFSFLGGQGGADRTLMFGGTSLGGGVTIQYRMDNGTFEDLPNASVTALPSSVVVGPLALDLQLVVTGSPNFNVTNGGRSDVP